MTAATSNPSTGAPTSGSVDFRRFRTWDAEPARQATPAWRILARYGYVRLASGWPGRTLLILLAMSAVLFVGFTSYSFAGGSGVGVNLWGGLFVFYLYPLAAILLLVGGPLFADDLRFNAPLFYFSKPLRVRDYFAGKLAFLGSLIAAGVLAPVLAFLLLALLVGVPAGHPPVYDPQAYYFQTIDPAEWSAEHIDSIAEWAAAVVVTLPGVLVAIAMFTSLAVACSVFTRRGWHAGIAFVALVGGTGIAGAVLSDSLWGAGANLGSPLGWVYIMVQLPIRLMFPPYHGYASWDEEQLAGAGTAIPLAYALALLTTSAALWASQARLAKQEARL